MKKCGIYAIQNKVNKLFYVGQSNNINHRWQCHKSDLRAGRHDNEHLQRAWDKYGAENFEFMILELLPEKYLDVAEVWWIKYLEAYTKGYNMTLGGVSTRGLTPWNKGKTHSDETKIKLSKSAKLRTGSKNPFYNKRHTEEVKEKIRKARAIPVIDLTNNVVYSSAKEADIKLGGKSSNVSKALNGKCKTAYGRKWAYMHG